MSESVSFAEWWPGLFGAVAGFAIGWFFFSGLRLTVARLARARRPAMLLLTSFVLRFGAAAAALTALTKWCGWVGALTGASGLLAARTLLLYRARSGALDERTP